MKEKESSNDQNEKQTEEREKKDAAFNTDWWKARGRRKRQVETDYEIEIFLVADFRDYSGWVTIYDICRIGSKTNEKDYWVIINK